MTTKRKEKVDRPFFLGWPSLPLLPSSASLYGPLAFQFATLSAGTLLGVYVVFRRNKKKMGDLVRNPRMRSAAMMGFQALLLGTGLCWGSAAGVVSLFIYTTGIDNEEKLRAALKNIQPTRKLSTLSKDSETIIMSTLKQYNLIPTDNRSGSTPPEDDKESSGKS
eukprot:gene25727-34304_t